MGACLPEIYSFVTLAFLQTMQHTGNRREHIALRQNAPSWADPRKTWRAHGRAHGRAMDVRVLEYHIV